MTCWMGISFIRRLRNLSEAIKTDYLLGGCVLCGFSAGLCIMMICVGDMFRINQLSEMLNLFYGKLIHFHLIYGSSNCGDAIGPWLLIISSLIKQLEQWEKCHCHLHGSSVFISVIEIHILSKLAQFINRGFSRNKLRRLSRDVLRWSHVLHINCEFFQWCMDPGL